MNEASNLYQHTMGKTELVFAFGFVLICLSLSKYFKFKMEVEFLLASLRASLQLSLIGYVLKWIFSSNSLGLNFLILFIMTLIAAQAVYSRLKKKSFQIYLFSLVVLFASVCSCGLLALAFLFPEGALRTSNFFVPFMGVLMGNALSAVSIAFLSLEKSNEEHQLEIENFRALGATRWEASHRLYREIFRTSLTPLLNGMTIVGVVSLPGIMAGQIIGGVNPLTAARFQIFVMLLMLLASVLGVIFAISIHHRYLQGEQESKGFKILAPVISNGVRLLLTGPSGSGKSRLLKSWVGLDANFLTSTVLLRTETEDPLCVSELSLDQSVRYLPQKNCFISGTVEENLKVPFEFASHQDKSYDRVQVERFFEKLGLDKTIMLRLASQLSGGEAQIVHFIRSFQLKPDLLYLDEPTSSLDANRTILFEKFLCDWTAVGGSFVMVSHDPYQVKRLATAVIRIP